MFGHVEVEVGKSKACPVTSVTKVGARIGRKEAEGSTEAAASTEAEGSTEVAACACEFDFAGVGHASQLTRASE